MVTIPYDEQLLRFIRALRAALATAPLYPSTHPVYRRILDELHRFVAELTADHSFLVLYFTARNVMDAGMERIPGGNRWLAAYFHQRLVKSLTVGDGVTTDELGLFLNACVMPVRTVKESGGLTAVMADRTPHITVEVIDPSTILENEEHGSGTDSDSVDWALLTAPAGKEGPSIAERAEAFSRTVDAIEAADLLHSRERRDVVSTIMRYLVDHDIESFFRCARSLLASVFRGRYLSGGADPGSLVDIFELLSPEQIASLLLDALQDGAPVNPAGFTVYFKLLGIEKHTDVARVFAGSHAVRTRMRTSPELVDAVSQLVSLPASGDVPAVYAANLERLLREPAVAERFAIDAAGTSRSYGEVVLDILHAAGPERLPDVITAACEHLCSEHTGERFVRAVADWWRQRRAEQEGFEHGEADRLLARLTEETLFARPGAAGLDGLLGLVRSSSFDEEHYLKRIFATAASADINLIRWFFIFFPEGRDAFIERFGQLAGKDPDAVLHLVKNMVAIDQWTARQLSTRLYTEAGTDTRAAIIALQQEFDGYDREFLMACLNDPDFSIRRETLYVISRFPELHGPSARALLSRRHRFGRDTTRLLANLALVEEFSLHHAEAPLRNLARLRFPWNRRVRRKAVTLLERQHGA